MSVTVLCGMTCQYSGYHCTKWEGFVKHPVVSAIGCTAILRTYLLHCDRKQMVVPPTFTYEGAGFCLVCS